MTAQLLHFIASSLVPGLLVNASEPGQVVDVADLNNQSNEAPLAAAKEQQIDKFQRELPIFNVQPEFIPDMGFPKRRVSAGCR